jgi:hypothetical protein
MLSEIFSYDNYSEITSEHVIKKLLRFSNQDR